MMKNPQFNTKNQYRIESEQREVTFKQPTHLHLSHIVFFCSKVLPNLLPSVHVCKNLLKYMEPPTAEGGTSAFKSEHYWKQSHCFLRQHGS